MENRYAEDFDFQAQVQTALAGELSDDRKKTLLDVLSVDVYAKKDYIFSQNLAKALKNQELFAVAGMMGQIITAEGLPEPDAFDDLPDYGNEKGTPQYPNAQKGFWGIKTGWIAALVIVLLGSGVYGILSINTANNNKKAAELVQKYIKPLEDNLNTATPRQGLADLDEGMKAYDAKAYTKAADLLGKYYRFSKDENAGLYTAIALLMTDTPPQRAEDILQEVLPKLEQPLNYPAEWYLILAKIKGNKAEAAKTQLQNMSADSPYKTEATELLAQLNQIK